MKEEKQRKNPFDSFLPLSLSLACFQLFALVRRNQLAFRWLFSVAQVEVLSEGSEVGSASGVVCGA